MRRLPPLSALRAFEAAARNRSFKRAAAELGVTPTAISHHIRSLEDHLQVSLFERRARQVTLTHDGARLYPVLREGFDGFARILQQIKADPTPATVTVSATTAFTARWLVPKVARFQLANPTIHLQLHSSDSPTDPNKGDVDIAIRYGRGPYNGYRAEHFFEDEFGVVASPSLGVQRPEDLLRAPIIDFKWTNPHPDHPSWLNWYQISDYPLQVAPALLTFTDESHAIQAVLAGQGVALLSLRLLAEELDLGRLVQPFGPTLRSMSYHLVEATGPERRPEVEAVRRWLFSELLLSTASRGSIDTQEITQYSSQSVQDAL